MAHEKRRHARDVFSECVCDDLERERVGLGLDALVHEYEQWVTRLGECGKCRG
jgi:hypothetical protein